MTLNYNRFSIHSAYVAAALALIGCTTTGSTEDITSRNFTESSSPSMVSMIAEQEQPSMIALPLVMLDKIEDQSAIAVDDNPITNLTLTEVAANDAYEQRQREVIDRKLAEMPQSLPDTVMTSVSKFLSSACIITRLTQPTPLKSPGLPPPFKCSF
jgi:hypothetical protein